VLWFGHWCFGILSSFVIGHSSLQLVAAEQDHAKIMEAMRGREEHVGVWQRYPFLGVPLVKEGPKVDGTVDTREWGASARVGFMLDYNKGMAVRDKTEIYVCYTPTHFYVGFQFERPQNAREPSSQDLFEMLFDWSHGHAKYGNIGLNLDKVLWTGVGPNVVKSAWQPVVEYKARTTEFGWEGELAIPWKEFKLDAAPAPGTIWGVDFVRNEKTPADRLAVWAFRGKNWHAVGNLGHMSFTGKPIAVQMQSVGWIEDTGQRGVKLLVSNFGDQPVTLDSFLELRRTDAKLALEYYPNIDTAMTEDLGAAIGSPLKKEIESTLKNYSVQKTVSDKITIAPHTSKLVQLTEAEEPGSYLASFALKDGETLLAGGLVPFRVLVPLAIKADSFLYSANRIAYEVDLRRVADKITDNAIVTVAALDKAGKALATSKHENIKGQEEAAGTLELTPKPDSTLFVRATITEGDKEIATNQEPVMVPPRPEWLGTKIGKKKFVPPPWQPIKATRKETEVMRVKYGWDGKSLLPSIQHKSLDLFAKPPTLTFKDKDGKPLAARMTRWKLAEKDVEQANYEFAAELEGKGSLAGKVKVEFDGLVWYWLTLKPKGTTELSGATLEFTVKKDFARLCTSGLGITSTKNQNYSGVLPAEGMEFPYTYMFWLGNWDGGVQWFAENNRNWFNTNEATAVSIKRTDTTGTLTIHFIDKLVALDKPTDWSFGFLPTPARTKPKGAGEFAFFQTGLLTTDQIPAPDPKDPNHWEKNNWYKYITGERWKFDKQFITCFIHHGYWQELFGYPGTFEETRATELKKSVTFLHSLGIKTIVYAGWGMNTEAPEWKDYGMEMVSLPLKNTGYGTFRQGINALWQDWFIYRTAQMIKDYDIDGLFIDSVTSPTLEENYIEGMRWTDAKGKLRGSYPLHASREWLKRLYKMWHGEIKKDGIIYNHHSPPAIMMIENFADVRCPSEFAQNYDGPLDGKFLDFYIAKNGGEQFGLYVEHTSKDWMGEWAKRKSNQLFAFALPLNITIKAVSLQVETVTKPSYALEHQPQPWIWAANKWVNRGTAEYLPWWRNANYITTQPTDEQVLNALWLHKGDKALLCVSNLKKEPRDIAVTLNLPALGFSKIEIEDALTGEKIPAADDKFSVKVDFERYRLLKVTNQKRPVTE
jgi:hypothetical protein